MNVQAASRMVIPSTFLILSIASAVYIVASTINYAKFFPALDMVQPSITEVAFTSETASKEGMILVSITIDNPSDYSGLNLAQLVLHIFFSAANSTFPALFQSPQLEETMSNTIPLPPHSRASVNMTISLDAADTNSLVSYYNGNNGRIRADSDVDAKLSTFLDAALGYIEQQVQQDNPLSWTPPTGHE